MDERGSYLRGVCRGCSLEAQLQQQHQEGPPAGPGGTRHHSSSQRPLRSRVRRNALECSREDQMRLAALALTGSVSLVRSSLSSDLGGVSLVRSSLSSDRERLAGPVLSEL